MSASENPPEQIDFAQASRVSGSGRHYTADIHPSWDGPLTTHGGLLQAIAVRAIDMEMNADDAMLPRSISAHYLRPPEHGKIDIYVDPIRRGRRFASTRATISQGGKPCITVVATHSLRGLEEVDSWAIPAPDVAGPPARGATRAAVGEIQKLLPDAWLEMPDGAPRFFEQLLLSPRFGAGPFSGPAVDPAVGTANGGWLTTPHPHPIDAAWLCLVVDALWPSVLEPLRKPAMAPTLDLTTHIRADLPPGGLPDQPLLVHNVSRALRGGLADSDSFVFSADGELLAQGRQLQFVQPVEL